MAWVRATTVAHIHKAYEIALEQPLWNVSYPEEREYFELLGRTDGVRLPLVFRNQSSEAEDAIRSVRLMSRSLRTLLPILSISSSDPSLVREDLALEYTSLPPRTTQIGAARSSSWEWVLVLELLGLSGSVVALIDNPNSRRARALAALAIVASVGTVALAMQADSETGEQREQLIEQQEAICELEERVAEIDGTPLSEHCRELGITGRSPRGGMIVAPGPWSDLLERTEL